MRRQSALALVRSPLTLVALQAIAGALLAPPIYALAFAAAATSRRRVWRRSWSGSIRRSPDSIFGDVHENGFAPAAVAWMLYAFDAGRLAWTLVWRCSCWR